MLYFVPIAVACSLLALDYTSRGATTTNLYRNILSLEKDYNQCAATINDLAIERFLKNEQLGEHWILTSQELVPEVLAITDGDVSIVGLPAAEINKGYDILIYAYNLMAIKARDEEVLNGKYENALKTFRLMLKFHPATEFKQALQLRIECIRSIASETNATSLIERYRELDPRAKPFSFLSKMHHEPSRVPNLLSPDVDMKKAVDVRSSAAPEE